MLRDLNNHCPAFKKRKEFCGEPGLPINPHRDESLLGARTAFRKAKILALFGHMLPLVLQF